MLASPPIFPVAINYLHTGTSAQLSVVIQKWTHRHISLNFTIEQSQFWKMCQNAKLFITSAHWQPIPFCIIMKRIDNIKKKHFKILKQHRLLNIQHVLSMSSSKIFIYHRTINSYKESKIYQDPTFYNVQLWVK